MTFSWNKRLSHSSPFKCWTMWLYQLGMGMDSGMNTRLKKFLPIKTTSTLWQPGSQDTPWNLATKMGESPSSERETLTTMERSMPLHGMNNFTSRKFILKRMVIASYPSIRNIQISSLQ